MSVNFDKPPVQGADLKALVSYLYRLASSLDTEFARMAAENEKLSGVLETAKTESARQFEAVSHNIRLNKEELEAVNKDLTAIHEEIRFIWLQLNNLRNQL